MKSDHLLQMKKGAKREKKGKEPVAKKIDPTVGSLRDKNESCSTRSGLRVDTGFEDF